MTLKQTDPEIAGLIEREAQRQASTLELIASENHVSVAVMEAAGSVLTNKYAEGYPERATTADASTTTRLKPSPSRAPRSCSTVDLPTYSLTAGPMPILLRSWR